MTRDKTQINTMHSKGLRVLRTDMSFEVLTIAPGTWSFTSGQLASKYDGVTRTFSPKRPHKDPDMGNSLGGKAQSSPRDAPKTHMIKGWSDSQVKTVASTPNSVKTKKGDRGGMPIMTQWRVWGGDLGDRRSRQRSCLDRGTYGSQFYL